MNQRTRDIGLRMALDAQRGTVLRLIVKETAVLTLIGIVLGIILAFTLSRVAENQLAALLYKVQATDPATYVGEVGVHPTKVCLDPTGVGLDPTGVWWQPTRVGMDPTSVGLNPTKVGVAPTGVGLNPTEVWLNPTGGTVLV